MWDRYGWNCPEITESFEPDRITIVLETPAVNTERMSGACQREVIIEYLTDNVSASPAVLAEVLGIKSSRTRDILRVMREEGIIEAQGSGRNRIYRLRS